MTPAERQWLAAFTEEYLKGWSLRGETQVMDLASRRLANSAHQRLRRHRDPLAFEEYWSPIRVHSVVTQSHEHARDSDKAELLILEAMEVHSSAPVNTEDALIQALDQKRRRRRDRR